MRINVCLPTYDRIEKLERAVQSIVAQDDVDIQVFVYVNGNYETFKKIVDRGILKLDGEKVALLFTPKRIGWVMAQNEIASWTEDALFYGADDIELEPGCLRVCVEEMESKFPDGDGVIGVNQINFEEKGLPCWPGAFGLVGQKFLLRFPERRLFCEDYIDHYSDVELVQYAQSVGKFYHAKNARVVHYHPMVTKTMDETARLVSKTHNAMWSRHLMRKTYGYLWGENFGRVYKAPDEVINERRKI